MTAPDAAGPMDGADRLEDAVAFSIRASSRIAATGVAVMLAIAAATVFDVAIYRALLDRSVLGLNEILQTVFAAALASALAGGVARRASLRADILLNAAAGRARLVADLAAEVLMLLFFLVLAFACWEQTARSVAMGAQTALLRIPTGPVVAAIAVFVTLCVPAQLINALIALRALVGWRSATGVLLTLALLVAGGSAVLASMLHGIEVASATAWSAPIVWALIVFAALWVLVLGGIPVAACLGFAGLLGTAAMLGWDRSLIVLGNETTQLFTNANLALIPLFLIMGALASVAGLSSDIYRLAQAALGARRGGLAMATVGACAGFGALTGSSVATAATIGSVALPQMRERGYAPSLALGCVAAGSTLGQLVPPSTVIVLYALLVEESIGQLYMAILIPAILTMTLYVVAVAVQVRIRPWIAPGATLFDARELLRALRGAATVIAVFLSVIGGIYLGVFTVTEAASVGVVLTFAAALMRGKLSGPSLWTATTETTKAIALIYPLIAGALMLTFFLDLAGLPAAATKAVAGLGLSPLMTIALLAVGFIALGTVMDSVAVMIITAGLVAPLVTGLGYDPIWWGVMMVVIVELGVVTPPFGLNLFMLKSIAPGVPTAQVYRGVLPFVVADLVKIALLIAFPALALWLPATMR